MWAGYLYAITGSEMGTTNVTHCAGSVYELESGQKVPFSVIGSLSTDLSLPYNPAEGFPYSGKESSSNHVLPEHAMRAAALVALLKDDLTPAIAHIDDPEGCPDARPAGQKRALGHQAGVQHAPANSLQCADLGFSNGEQPNH